MILYHIVATNSFNQVDLNRVKHTYYSEHAISIPNFSLSKEDKFTEVNVAIIDGDLCIVFHTNNPIYFNNPNFYFQRKVQEKIRQPFEIYGKSSQTQEKNLGNFDFLPYPVPPASVYITNSSVYGYTITLNFYRHNIKHH